MSVPCVADVTPEVAVVGVTVADVRLEARRRRHRHLTERTLVVTHCRNKSHDKKLRVH